MFSRNIGAQVPNYVTQSPRELRLPLQRERSLKSRRGSACLRTQLPETHAGIYIIHHLIKVFVRDELCCCFQQSVMGRDSSIGIATRYGLDGFGLRNLVVATFSAPVQTGLGFIHLSIPWAGGPFPGP
jgi:hypothetical protein